METEKVANRSGHHHLPNPISVEVPPPPSSASHDGQLVAPSISRMVSQDAPLPCIPFFLETVSQSSGTSSSATFRTTETIASGGEGGESKVEGSSRSVSPSELSGRVALDSTTTTTSTSTTTPGVGLRAGDVHPPFGDDVKIVWMKSDAPPLGMPKENTTTQKKKEKGEEEGKTWKEECWTDAGVATQGRASPSSTSEPTTTSHPPPSSPSSVHPFASAEKTVEPTSVPQETETNPTTSSPPPNTTTPTSATQESSCADIPIWRVVRLVWSYVWPKGDWKMKALVVSSVGCVLLGKTLKVMVPFAFKGIVDSLSAVAAAGEGGGGASSVGAGVAVATASTTTMMMPFTSIPFTLTVTGFLLAYGVSRVAGSFADEWKNVLFAPVGGAGTTNLAMQTMRKLHSLDLPYHLNREIGGLSKDLDRGSRAFWNFAYILLFLITPTLFEMCLVGTALYTQGGGQFILVGTMAIATYVLWTFSVTNWRAKFRTRFNYYDTKVSSRVVDSLMNYETVKYFGSEEYECARIEKEMRCMNRQLVILDQTIALLNMGQQLIFAAATVGSLYMATCGVLTGVMTVGDLVLVDGLLLQLYMPLSYLGMIYRDIQSSTQNMQAMLSIMDTECVVKDAPGARPYQYKDGTIEFRNVSFEYLTVAATPAPTRVLGVEGGGGGGSGAKKPKRRKRHEKESSTMTSSSSGEGGAEGNDTTGAESRPANLPVSATATTTTLTPPSLAVKKRLGVLHKINFTIPGGSVVAFVGASGSGKSTIFRLLFRFFNPTEGVILLDGQPIHELQIPSVRQHIGVIPQDPSLFNDSIRYNVCYSRATPTSDEEVIQAAREAYLHETVMAMPEGYATSVGERGCRLSGGEKQRVAIARALLDDKPILLADEATSALDVETEEWVMRALQARRASRDGHAKERKGTRRTLLLIAHRLTTVKEADIIFVLRDGSIAEYGDHETLLAQHGMYAQLWERQLEEKAEEAEEQEE